MMRHRAGTFLAVLACLAIGLPADAYAPPTATGTTAYVAGTSLRWTAFEQQAANGPIGLDEAVRLSGVGGGAMGIVEVGADLSTGTAASWVSTDGGVNWTEHMVTGTAVPAAFGRLAAHGGTLVTTAANGIWWSRDGATWMRSATGSHAIRRASVAAGPQGFAALVRAVGAMTTRAWTSSSGTVWSAAPVQAVLAAFCADSMAASSSRVVAVGRDCGTGRHPRVLVSTGGRTWSLVGTPYGLGGTTNASYHRSSLSYVSGRFLLAGPSSTGASTLIFSSLDGRSWRRLASVPRQRYARPDRIDAIMRLGSGWIAGGDVVFTIDNDEASEVFWKSADLVHWTRVRPPVATCHASVRSVNQAVVIRNTIVAVGFGWGSFDPTCAPTWTARVVP